MRPGIIIATAVGIFCGAVAITGFIIHSRLTKNHAHVLFETNGGPVLFPHQHHSDNNGGAFECTECHHKYDVSEKSPPQGMKCRACHYDDPDVAGTVCADSDSHPRCIGKKCNTCHEGESCTFCHRPLR